MKKILVSLMAAMMVLAMSVPAFAGPGGTEHRYQGDDAVHPQAGRYLEDITGDDSTAVFAKYFITKDGARVPNVTFEYTIEAGTGIDAVPGTSFEVLKPGASNAGGKPNASGTPVMKSGDAGKAVFGPSSQTWDSPQGTDTVHLDANEQYSKANVTIDFSQVTFYEPGVYRYVVKETKPATPALPGMIYDSQEVETVGTIPDASGKSVPKEGTKERTLDVYVTDDGSGKLVISQYVLHELSTAPSAKDRYDTEHGTDDVDTNGKKLADKSEGFVNEYKTIDLEVKKEVSGNQASKDKYFKFTLTVSSPTLTDDDLYVISIAPDSDAATNDGSCDAVPQGNAATVYTGMKNYETLTSGVYYVKGSTLNSGFDFYLQHGQHIVFRDLPAGAQYTVVEVKEDYKEIDPFNGDTKNTAYTIANHKNKLLGTLSTNDEIDDATGDPLATGIDPDGIVRTGILNKRAGIIPTGIIMSVAGGFAIVMIALAFLFMINRKKDHYDYE